jgi:hypothetical protein
MSQFLLRTLLVAGIAAGTAATTALAADEVQSIQVTGSALRPLFPREAQGVVGTYRLSDGRSLSLRQHGGAVVARMSGEPRAKLLLAQTAGGWQLQAPDGHMQIGFDLDINGFAKTVAVTLDRKPGDEATVVATATRLQLP